MKAGIRYIAIRIMLLILLWVALNQVYQAYFFEKDLNETASYLNTLRSLEGRSDILYFGESSNFNTHRNDRDQQKISEFIAGHYPGLRLGTVDHSALHAGIYRRLLHRIDRNSPVKTVIITMNLRSFNSGWIWSDLENLLNRDAVMLSDAPPLMKRFLLGLKAYEIMAADERKKILLQSYRDMQLGLPAPFPYKTTFEWDSAVANGGFTLPDYSWDMDKIKLATAYIKAYAFRIDTLNNPRIHDFDEIVRYARKRNWNLVFNLMAENTTKAEELCGKELLFLIRKNRDLLMERYNKNGVIVVDNLELVPPEDFTDQDWTTEHYNEEGRKLVACNAAMALRDFYPGMMKMGKETDIFLNDFEETAGWHSEGTITDEIARSGRKSCVVSGEHPYSATWMKEWDNAGNRKYVMASVWYYAKQLITKSMLIISCEKPDGTSILWKSRGLDVPEASMNKWNGISLRVPLEALTPGDRIKVYVWSPEGETLYLDDFEMYLF